MMRLFGVRPEDRRTIAIAFATLLAIVAAHAVLETARDTLFLADLPASRLPWAYLGIATFAFGVSWLGARVPSSRRALVVTLLVGAAGTACLWELVAAARAWSLMTLYVWTGLLASTVVSAFWIQLGTQVDVGQARRAYALIAAGGMLGATLGSLLAAGALTLIEPRELLLLASVLFAVAAGVAAFATPPRAAPEPSEPAAPEEPAPPFATVWADPYLKRLLLLAVIGPVVAMGIDFVWKTVVSHEVPRAELGHFFSRFNTVVNACALAFQVILAPRLLQHIGVVRNLCLLPACLGVVAAGVAGGPGLAGAAVLRGTDGVLRHSLHRAATEILFLPMTAATRRALRGLAESLGQRGGQVLGSGAILLAMLLGATPRQLAGGVAVLCAVWLFSYLRLHAHYVERFRSQLGVLNAAPDAAVPELDLRSLETLVATLSAENDQEVLAALDLLETYGRTRLVSPLVLYHPSPAVVLRALALFDGAQRADVVAIRHRLLEHAEPTVRAATLRGVVTTENGPETIRRVLRSDPSPLVRSTALVLWLGLADTPDRDLREAVSDAMALADTDAQLAVARALGQLPPRAVRPVAEALLERATPAVRREVARVLATEPDDGRIELLTRLLAMPECRPYARSGLRTLGAPALEHLATALADPSTPGPVRRHLPRSISVFASVRAAEILVTQLARERGGGRVAYKILRGLGRMRTNDPTLAMDVDALMVVAERILGRMVELTAYRVAWDLRRELPDVARHEPGEDLAVALLDEEEQRALERVCRVLQVLEPAENFATIYAALSADSPVVRAEARELIGHVLAGAHRDGLLAMTDSVSRAERLAAAARVLPVAVAAPALDAWQAWSSGDDPRAVAAGVARVVEAMERDRSVVLASVVRWEVRAADGAPPVAQEVTRAAS